MRFFAKIKPWEIFCFGRFPGFRTFDHAPHRIIEDDGCELDSVTHTGIKFHDIITHGAVTRQQNDLFFRMRQFCSHGITHTNAKRSECIVGNPQKLTWTIGRQEHRCPGCNIATIKHDDGIFVNLLTQLLKKRNRIDRAGQWIRAKPRHTLCSLHLNLLHELLPHGMLHFRRCIC